MMTPRLDWMKTAALALAVTAGLANSGAANAGSVETPLQIGGAYSVRVTSLQEARYAATVRQQYDFSCGSAALATLLTHHYAFAVTETQVLNAMLQGTDPERVRHEGFSLLDMKRYLAAAGFESDGFEAGVAELEAAGLPAIAVVKERGYNHFVVVKGVREGRVLIADPAAGTRALSVAAFEAMRSNAILFVIGNYRDSARFNAVADWRVAPRAPLSDRGQALADVAPVWRGGSDF